MIVREEKAFALPFTPGRPLPRGYPEDTASEGYRLASTAASSSLRCSLPRSTKQKKLNTFLRAGASSFLSPKQAACFGGGTESVPSRAHTPASLFSAPTPPFTDHLAVQTLARASFLPLSLSLPPWRCRRTLCIPEGDDDAVPAGTSVARKSPL